jgi:aspartate/methionine/tyrosine aminotransferase
VPELADRCVVVNGVAKTYAMTGWRVGWMVGPDDVIAAAANLQSHATSNVANVAQRAALAAVSGGLEDVSRFREAFNRRRLTMFEMLRAIDGVEVLLPEGAFYAYPSFEAFIGTKVAGRQIVSTLDLAAVVLEEAKVAIVPGEAFGTPGYARLSFALGDDDLAEGISRIGKLLG